MGNNNDEQFRKSQSRTGNADNARILKEDAEKNANKTVPENQVEQDSVKVSDNKRVADQQ